MYVAVKGGERAIANAHALLAKQGRGDLDRPRIEQAAVAGQLGVLVARVMTEGSLYDPALAARAILQAQGDVLEAVTLVRSYRTTLPRFGYTLPVDTARLPPQRRISATFKDLPGGQQLGATFDYTHRLLDFALAAESEPAARPVAAFQPTGPMPRVAELLVQDGLIEAAPATQDTAPRDLTREPLEFPADRALRLQNLARGDEGFLLAMGYSTQRGYGKNHPFAGEIRIVDVAVEIVPEELGFPVEIGQIRLTECDMVNQFKGSAMAPAQFTRGYGLAFGQSERKAMAMALVDRALRAGELGEAIDGPAQDEEFVMSHSDNVQATGFVEHLKLPHYVDFQSELDLVRRLRAAFGQETP